jgi:hypothetical protein
MSAIEPSSIWKALRDAEGKTGHIGPLAEAVVEKAKSRLDASTKDLIEILLIPGVLCSAAPQVIRTFLEVLPVCTARAKRELLFVIFELGQTAFSHQQESIARYSNGAIDPYNNYEELRKDLISAIQSGERFYRAEFRDRPRKSVKETEFCAAVLLSLCSVCESTTLDRFDAAIAAAENPQRQALLFEGAMRIAGACGIKEDYLRRYLDMPSPFAIPRLIAACALPQALDEAELRRAVGDPSARFHICLPDMLSVLDAKLRQRVYSAIFRSGALLAGEPIWYGFELLKAAFNSVVEYSTRKYYKDAQGVGHTDFVFRGTPDPRINKINDEQREALTILVECDAMWTRKSNMLAQFGLPESRDEILNLISASAG